MKFEKTYELSATGHLYVGDDVVRINTDIDICKYYQWFINKEYFHTVKTQLPKHKAHITIVNPKIHGVRPIEKVKHLDGIPVKFAYSLDIHRSPRNFWLPAYSELGDEIKRILGIVESKNYWGLHLTICNTKFCSK